MSCRYADKGCAHADGCVRRYEDCGYARYFDFLEEFSEGKDGKP